MRRIDIEIAEDPSHPEGGHAVILMHGLDSVPARSVVRIRPLEVLAGADGSGVRSSLDRLPLASRSTARGVELVVGPDVVDNPHLLPGVATIVEVPAAEVLGEVLWPRLTPSNRPRRHHLATVRPERVGDPTSTAPSTMEGAIASAATLGSATRRSQLVLAAHAPDAAAGHSPGDAPFDTIAEEAVVAERASPSNSEIEAPPPAVSVIADGTVDATPDQVAGIEAPATSVRSSQPGAAKPSGSAVVMEAPASPSRARRRGLDPRGIGNIGGWVLVSLAAVALAALVGHFAPRWSRGDLDGHHTAAFYTSLATSDRSPRGVAAGSVDRAATLERADELLHPPTGSRDSDEAAFWLRRHLASTLGDRRTAWALTQLGTLIAEPERGAPDFATARGLWEIAAAYDDGMALCFLGKMDELGFGGPADKRRALAWFQRARAVGGCKDAEAAITRLSR